MDEPTITAPASYGQPSRKGKKAWRKNVDISDIQSGLETVREEIIATGGVIAEKAADELFTTDVIGDVGLVKRPGVTKWLKCDEILAQRSPVLGLTGRKKRKSGEGNLNATPMSSKRYKRGDYVPYKEVQRLRAVADNVNGAVEIDEPSIMQDLWAETETTRDPSLNYLDETRSKKEPKTLKHAPKSLTASGKMVPSVRKPEAGKSYNPLVGDWAALLEREGAAAVEAEIERLRFEADAAEKEARAAAEAAKVEQQEREELASDYESAWESEWEGFQSGTECNEVFTQKPPRRKTVAEKNKIKARKEREALERRIRKDRERAAQEKRIQQIAREISAREKARNRRSSSALMRSNNSDSSESDDGVEPALQKRRFGKLPIPEPPLEVVLPDELQDSLRRLKPEGDLLTDRYRNLLVNGKLEVRKRRDKEQYKQARKFRTEKWSYKDWKLR
ncbi:hypothetical protein M433DRAFT_141240 [Acidomyces richmondensis BFW]|nr:MAG: hypothetical protein FE78DRAFT_33104 [Acidomyces sp. 'richmondensis']KYG48210.1 hypothetical protein M433DRAFT_141240 [Acidomyces richmondensis BFW]